MYLHAWQCADRGPGTAVALTGYAELSYCTNNSKKIALGLTTALKFYVTEVAFFMFFEPHSPSVLTLTQSFRTADYQR